MLFNQFRLYYQSLQKNYMSNYIIYITFEKF